MRSIFLGLILSLCSLNTYSQALYRTIDSKAMGQDRNVKILKPRDYAQNTDKTYPLIIVLDGDYLFEPVAGNVDYLSFWGQIPECFVVGINQAATRNDDCALDPDTGMPAAQSAQFIDFMIEIKSILQQEYRIAPFTLIIGKDMTANVSAFNLLLKDVPVQAMLHIEPEFTEVITDNLIPKAKNTKQFYGIYAASSVQKKSLQALFNAKTAATDEVAKSNKKITYETIAGTNTYDVAMQAIPRGLKFLFKEFAVIDAQEFLNEKTATGELKNKSDLSALDKLKEKYASIKSSYGINMQVRLVDVVSIAEYLIEKKQWDALMDVSAFSHKNFPNLLYGKFIEGMAYEGLGRPDRAIKSYNAAYVLDNAVGIDKNMVLDKIEYLQSKK